jgi:hypothetical protein
MLHLILEEKALKGSQRQIVEFVSAVFAAHERLQATLDLISFAKR